MSSYKEQQDEATHYVGDVLDMRSARLKRRGGKRRLHLRAAMLTNAILPAANGQQGCVIGSSRRGRARLTTALLNLRVRQVQWKSR